MTRRQSCATEHDYDKFDDWRIFCRRCGTFQTAPTLPRWPTYPVYPWYPSPWTTPYVYPVWSVSSGVVQDTNTVTVSSGIGNLTTLNSGD